MGIGFVIMPFGGDFDEIYQEIYVPAIEAVGLTPLRADEIYNNQSIAQDIYHSIHNAEVILADVTGKNPNVNYELGAAHALGKEVIITTANAGDVPSDYRHIKYIEYHRGELDWNRKFSDKIIKTLQTVLSRLHNAEAGAARPQSAGSLFDLSDQDHWEADDDESDITELAKGYEARFFDPAHDTLQYKDCRVQVAVRDDGPSAQWAEVAYLLNEDVRWLAQRLPNGHYLKMRWLFIDNYASHGFGVDYLYRAGSLPIFTRRELIDALSRDLSGQLFDPQIRYLEEKIDCDTFDPNADEYYSHRSLPNEQQPISWRNGCYIAEVERVFQAKSGHCFYRLRARLPLSIIHAESYAPGESHWLADWGQAEPRCAAGDLVSFQCQKVYPIASWDHVSNARNVSFSELKILEHAMRL